MAAPANHPLKLAITRHKARLSAEFTKLRVKRGFGSINAFRQHMHAEADSGGNDGPNSVEHPRWVRVNAVRTTLDAQLSTTFKDYDRKEKLSDVMSAPATSKVLHIDAHIPNLLALPPRADLSRVKAYQAGELIIQDKASCFPAYLLNLQPTDGDAIDGCAAPGNKTTHLAAIVAQNRAANPTIQQHITACERDKRRSAILDKMVRLAGAANLVTVKPRQDFLNLDPSSPACQSVAAILLDPSCSGSGIVTRDDAAKLVLPSASTAPSNEPTARSSKKRKRKAPEPEPEPVPVSLAEEEEEEEVVDTDASTLRARLTSLAAFQLKLLRHAMTFPAARKLTYSTCSIHAAENELVVLRALASREAVGRGWRVLRREEQVEGMRRWGVRGVDVGALGEGEGVGEGVDVEEVREACIRCEKGTGEGTMGFFVAAFVREGEDGDGEVGEEEGEDEWNGFSDGE